MSQSEGIPELSRARHYLLGLAKKRQLADLARTVGMQTVPQSPEYVYLWQVKEGLRRPSMELMQRLSSIIPIADWFASYDGNEEIFKNEADMTVDGNDNADI